MSDLTIGHDLISSARIEGTAVYDRRAQKVGSVHSVMIDKTSGKAVYAILSFGGFWGLGASAYPLPWEMLTYSTELKGYCLSITREDIESAPYMALDRADRPQELPEPVYRHWDQYL